jgi:UDP-N-acetylmuramate--alanine ligase
VLDATGLDPTAVIGGRVMGRGDLGGARLGHGGLMVAEADESDGSFLRLAPVISVITNIDPEHLDHYGTLDRLRDAFVAFAESVPFWGLAVLCIDHPGVQAILSRIHRRHVGYGFSSQADWLASEVVVAGRGMRFTVHENKRRRGEVTLPVPGRHNVLNALATLAVVSELDVEFSKAAAALADFGGVERRFEQKGEAAGVKVVDDYAHHPAEIRATLEAARGVHGGRIVAIFQPHRFTRTRDCMDEFATSFEGADRLIVCEVYAAGDDPIPGIDGSVLCERIRAHGHRDASFSASIDDLSDRLAKELSSGDLVLTLGAGDIHRLGPLLLEQLRGGARR